MDTHTEQQQRAPGPRAKAAAAYWANFLKTKQDPGDYAVQMDCEPERRGLLYLIQSAKLRHQTALHPDTIEAFEKHLGVFMQHDLDMSGSCSVGVDYHPDDMLSQAAFAACVDEIGVRLPIKTSTHIPHAENIVRVSHGYGAPYVRIWPVNNEKQD